MSSSVPRYSLRAPISLPSSRGSSATMGYPSQPSIPLRRAGCTARGSAALVVHRPGRHSGSCCRLALCAETGTRSRGETGCAGDREPVGQASPSPWRHRAAAKRRPERLPVPSSAGERSPDQYGPPAQRRPNMTKHDPRADRDASLPGEHPQWRGQLAGRCRLPVSARATAGPLAAFPALVRALGDVRQQRKLPGALDSARDLALMAAARSRDPPRADLAALGDEPAQRRNVLVVDPVDLVPAVRAGLAPTRGRSVRPVAPGASRPFTLLCQPGFL